MHSRTGRLFLAAPLCLMFSCVGKSSTRTDGPAPPRLLGRAILLADTFAAGPPSGARLAPNASNGRPLPFPGQPVQGFSALIAEGNDTYLSVVDNGYGAPDNSADFLLRVYRLHAKFADGVLTAEPFFTLSDPNHLVPFGIVNEFTAERVLTGADFDPESMQRVTDGTFWFGDELGPFLLHTDAEGRVLEPPFPAPERAATNPLYEEGALVKVLEAMRADAAAHRAAVPVLSPAHRLIADEDPSTFDADRGRSVSSELVNVAALKHAGFDVVPWTVNDPARAEVLLDLGVAGLITDRPDLMMPLLEDHPGVEIQGHRGARGLRPENTLPAFEAALDVLVDTLETDLQLTSDGVAVLWHDFELPPTKCRGTGERVIQKLTVAQLQDQFTCDLTLKDFPDQSNKPEKSPVAAAFAKTKKWRSPYTPVSLEQLFEFVGAYARHYAATDPKRAAAATKVRFNLETKVNPRPKFAGLSPNGDALTTALATAVQKALLDSRVTVQSFDWSTLRFAHQHFPTLRTVLLLADESGDEGLNLQPDASGKSPLLAGLPWPHRRSWNGAAPRVGKSGGFEALALEPGGKRLLAVLEKPLELPADADPDSAPAVKSTVGWWFDLETKTFSPAPSLRLASGACCLTELQFDGPKRVLGLERDDTQHDLNGVKRLAEWSLDGATAHRRERANLLALEATQRQLGADDDLGLGPVPFALPFWTIEGLAMTGENQVAIIVDNNYPFGRGRHATAIDDTELVTVQLAP